MEFPNNWLFSFVTLQFLRFVQNILFFFLFVVTFALFCVLQSGVKRLHYCFINLIFISFIFRNVNLCELCIERENRIIYWKCSSCTNIHPQSISMSTPFLLSSSLNSLWSENDCVMFHNLILVRWTFKFRETK